MRRRPAPLDWRDSRALTRRLSETAGSGAIRTPPTLPLRGILGKSILGTILFPRLIRQVKPLGPNDAFVAKGRANCYEDVKGAICIVYGTLPVNMLTETSN